MARHVAADQQLAGLEGLGRSLALIGAKEGVRVNVLAPGAFDTPFDEKLAKLSAKPSSLKKFLL